MIVGIGTDLVDMGRIEKVIQRVGLSFSRRILGPAEHALLTPGDCTNARLLAKRFAAKEACSKAMGCGIGRHVGWHDMEVHHRTGTPPHLALSSRATAYLRGRLKGEGEIQLDLSLSDEYPYAQAFVIISCTLKRTP